MKYLVKVRPTHVAAAFPLLAGSGVSKCLGEGPGMAAGQGRWGEEVREDRGGRRGGLSGSSCM